MQTLFLGSLSQSLDSILRRAVGNQLQVDSGCDMLVKGLVHPTKEWGEN